jgi:transporter family protein
MTSQWWFWALLSAVLAAATALLSKAGLKGVDSDAALLVRTAVVLLTTAALVVISGRWQGMPKFTGRTWALLTLAGLATAASWLCYFRALDVGDVSRVAVVDKLSVVIIAVVAAIVFGERLGPIGWLGVALATAGVALISFAPAPR